MQGFPILHSDEQLGANDVKRVSSVSQYNNAPLTVIVGGVALPLSYDVIDYIECKCVHSHRAFLINEGDIGYHYRSGVCHYMSDIYLVYDKDGRVVEKPLPAECGEGNYLVCETGSAVAVGDNAGLGVHNEGDLRIGLDYVKTDTVLQGED